MSGTGSHLRARGIAAVGGRAIAGLIIGFWVLGSAAPAVQAHGAVSRQKPGPVTIRGTALHVQAHGFTLHTGSHGDYAVVVAAATQLSEKGKTGHVTLHDGDHVGVHGFVEGRQIRAIWVHIYPSTSKPKPYSLNGTVVSVHGSTVVISAGGKTTAVVVTGKTTLRMGSATVSSSRLRAGEHVDARVQQSGRQVVAIHIRIFQPPQVHVQVRGAVLSAGGSTLVVSSGGKRETIRLSSATVIYLGNEPASSRDLQPGREVTVFACCAGETLTASSIHIQRPAPPRTVLVRGRVVSLSATQITLSSGTGTVTVSLSGSTVYEVGSSRPGRSGVHTGDEVSVRGYRSGSVFRATRVHVYVSARRSSTISGVVVSSTRSGLVVSARGRRYTITVGSSATVSLGGQTAPLSALRPGDKVRVTGQSTGAGGLAARSVRASRPAPKVQTVRGTITNISGSTVTIRDQFGGQHRVVLSARTRTHLNGKPASVSALFPGAQASARGTMSGNALAASTLTVSAKSRSVTGTVTSLSANALVVRLASGETLRVDLAGYTGRARAQVGARVRVRGYEVRQGTVRATSLTVLHPKVSFSAIVLSTTGGLTVATSQGQRYRLRLTSSTTLSTGREQITLKPAQIPVGAHVHVAGTLASDGSVSVTELTVRLTSVTLRGKITAIAQGSLSVTAGQATDRVKLGAATTFEQGSHTLTLADLVVGDDVTVYGYDGGAGLVLARRILVHRKIIGLDGSVLALNSGGFQLAGADGVTHPVLLDAGTLFSNGTSADLAVGISVHVTGYLRGDGSILATRVRLVKKKGP